MYENLKRRLKLQTLDDQIKKVSEIHKSLENVEDTLDSLAEENTRKTEEKKFILKSEDYTDEIKEAVKNKYEVFLKSYSESVKETLEKRRRLQKAKSTLLSDEEIKKAYEEIVTFQKAKKQYKDGEISSAFFDMIVKAKTGVVKYADNIVWNEKGEILLLQRSSLDSSNPGKWVIPGGHVDLGEDCSEAAKRELYEEAGLEPKDFRFLDSYKAEGVEISYYESRIDTQNQEVVLEDSETHQYVWINPKNIDEYEMVFNMKDNIKKLLFIDNEEGLNVLKKAFLNKELSQEDFLGLMEKAKSEEKVGRVMSEFKQGKLRSSSGDKVTDRKQAIAIAMSEAGLSKSEEHYPGESKEEYKTHERKENKQTEEKEHEAGGYEEVQAANKFIFKLKELFSEKGEFSEYGNRFKLKDLQFWPQGLDLENCDMVDLDEEKAIFSIGGDWQTPMYVGVHLSKDDGEKEENATLRICSLSYEYNQPKASDLEKKKKELGFVASKVEKSEDVDDLSKSKEEKHLRYMIQEHERLIPLLGKFAESDDQVKKELETQKKELSEYKEELKKLTSNEE